MRLRMAGILFTNNETNGSPSVQVAGWIRAYIKDAFHRYIINGENCVDPEETGTKTCIHYIGTSRQDNRLYSASAS